MELQQECSKTIGLVLQMCMCVYPSGVLYSKDAAVEGWRMSSREQDQCSGHHYNSR